MGKRYTQLTGEQTGFIRRQKIFFAGTAAADGGVDVSPKGMDILRVITANHIFGVPPNS